MKNMIISSLIIALLLAISLNISARGSLTFEERVKAQEAIERVYYDHRIWPKENPQPKPSFEQMVPKEAIESKVTDYLKICAAIDKYWQRPIESGQLQAEMERMAKRSKDPATLNELFAALNNDPYLIAECLARPMLADRLGSNWYANDERFHGETKAKAEEVLKTLAPDNFCSTADGVYGHLKFKLVDDSDVMDEDQSMAVSEEELATISSMVPEQGGISGIVGLDDCFAIYHTISKNEIEIEYETLVFPKVSFKEWLKGESINYKIQGNGHAAVSFCLPTLYTPPSCEGYWSSTSLVNAPEARRQHSSVWTGTEMIIWGGGLSIGYTNTGGMYIPATDTWSPTSTGANCPQGRSVDNGAVWTGMYMIVWGGYCGGIGLTSGGRYNPITDQWESMSSGLNCPNGRWSFSAIWTGTEMIIWGGNTIPDNYVNTGGRYNPSSDSWIPTSTGVNCPLGRQRHTALWTGSEMVVWGGAISGGYGYRDNTGGRYNPITNSWNTPTSTGINCPMGRSSHTAIWTGTEMIIWGGDLEGEPWCTNTGGRYNPQTDAWIPTSIGSNVPAARYNQEAIWTDEEMVIWGGTHNGEYNTGGRYNPALDRWIPTSIGEYCPSKRQFHSMNWTGSNMIVWGGWKNGDHTNTGGIYYIPSSPSSPANFLITSAQDLSQCTDEGVRVTWKVPGCWGDDGEGTRTFDVLRDELLIVTGLSETVTSYIDTSGENGISYFYKVRANNGSGVSTTTPGVSATDIVRTIPDEVTSFTLCNWDPVPGADDYRVYRGTFLELSSLMNSDPEGCLLYEGTATNFDCSGDDPSMETDRLYWYLVTAYSGPCEGSAGEGTDFTRDLSSYDICF